MIKHKMQNAASKSKIRRFIYGKKKSASNFSFSSNYLISFDLPYANPSMFHMIFLFEFVFVRNAGTLSFSVLARTPNDCRHIFCIFRAAAALFSVHTYTPSSVPIPIYLVNSSRPLIPSLKYQTERTQSTRLGIN